MSWLGRKLWGASKPLQVSEAIDCSYGNVPDPISSNLGLMRQWLGIYHLVDRLARARGGNIGERPIDERMLYIARGLMRYNPYAQGMIAALRNHTLGSRGFKITPTGPSRKVLGRWLELWQINIDWWQWERELYERVHIEGEAIIRYFPMEDTVELRPIEPEWIVAKDGTQEWTFGFQNAPDDVHNILALHELTNHSATIDASEWYHIKSKNAMRAEKRGRSDFLAVAQLLDDSFKTWRNFLQSEAVRQSVVYFAKQAAGVTTQDLEQAIAAESDYGPPANVNGNRLGEALSMRYGAAVEYIQDGTEVLAVPAANSQGTMTGVNAGLLAAGRAYHIPLVLMSGDMSANNTLDFGDESPFGATIKDEQNWYSRHVKAIIWKAVEYAVEEGLLPVDVLHDGTDLDVAAERRSGQRASENTSRAKTLYDDGVISARERATMEGVDYDEQQEQRRREAAIIAAGNGDPSGGDAELRGTVGGLQAITALQQQFYAGSIPQAAAIASLMTLFGFTEAEAAAMLPPVQPVQRTGQTNAMEDVLVTVHRNGKTFTQHRRSGKAKPKSALKSPKQGAGKDSSPNTRKPAVKASVAQQVAEAPLDKTNVPATLVGKMKEAAKKVWLEANVQMQKLSGAALKVGAVMSEVFDTPDDMKRFAYNPTTSGGVASHANNDFVASNLNDAFGVGVSGHLVASIASKVIAKAFFYAKSKLGGKTNAATEDVDTGVMELAQFIHDVYERAFKALGVKGKQPSVEDIAKNLQDHMKDVSEGFTGIDSHGHKWVNGKQVAIGQDSGGSQHDWTKTHATSKVVRGLRASKGLSDEQRAHYNRAAATVLSVMPAAAHDRMAKGMHTTSFHPDIKSVGLGAMDEALATELTPQSRAYVQGLRDKMEAGTLTVAGVASSTGTVHVDGGVPANLAGDTISKTLPDNSTTHVCAHEWTHAIDGPDHQLSSSDDWKQAHSDELAGAQLTKYAATKPSEGFAEFGRLLYASSEPLENVEQSFPKASKFFKDNGLWPTRK